MNTQGSNTVIVSLVAAILAPKVERYTGVKLTPEDQVALVAGAVTVFHAAVAAFERYFPPPQPVGPAHVPQEAPK